MTESAFHLEDPILDLDGDVALLDGIAAAGRETTDRQRLDWLDQEGLVIIFVEGRKVADISQQKISYDLNLGTIHNQAAIVRLVTQGHADEAIATLLGYHEGVIKNRRQRIRRWLTALAKRCGMADLVDAWDKSRGNKFRLAQI